MTKCVLILQFVPVKYIITLFLFSSRCAYLTTLLACDPGRVIHDARLRTLPYLLFLHYGPDLLNRTPQTEMPLASVHFIAHYLG